MTNEHMAALMTDRCCATCGRLTRRFNGKDIICTNKLSHPIVTASHWCERYHDFLDTAHDRRVLRLYWDQQMKEIAQRVYHQER